MYNGSTLPAGNTWSEATRQTYLLQQLVLQNMWQNRLPVEWIEIPVDGNTVALAEELSSGQLVAVAGEENATGMPVTGSDLWGKVAANGVTGGTFPERATVVSAIRTATPITIASGIVVGIITSADIEIELTGGHNLKSLWFAIVPAQYFPDPS